MKRTFQFFLLAACILWAAPTLQPIRAQDSAVQDGEKIDARITQAQGAVYLHLHDKEDGEFIPAETDSPLEDGDQVRTDTDGTAEISLGGDSLIELGPNSDFIVASLDPRRTEFHLGMGHLVAKLRSLLNWQHMEFHTATAVASVRGTELAVAQEHDDAPAQIGVFDEGHVAVRTQGDSREIMLGPGQETEVRRGQAPVSPRQLQALAQYRRHMSAIRPRLQAIRANWRKRSPAQLRRLRRRLVRKTSIRALNLKNIRKNRPRSHQWPKKPRAPRRGPQGRP